MKTNSRIGLAGVLLGAVVAAFLAAPSRGQVATSAEKDEAAKKETFRERTIYIPYEKLRKVFEARGRGVFLPYEEFQELWKAAREKAAPPSEDKPPLDSVINEVEAEGTVAGDVMQFKAKLAIELLRKGWHKIPLRLGDAAITRATLDGKPARIVADPGRGYVLLVERGAEATDPIALELDFAKAIARAPGRNQVSVEVPQAPVSRWRITIPEPGVKVDIQPLLAASEAPEEKSAEPAESDKKAAGKTVVLAFVGATPTVSIAWTPKTEGATGLAALATVRAAEVVRIDEGVMRTQYEMTYTISRAKLAKLAVAVPADQKVVNVFDANVRQWSVAKEDGRQRIDVQLFEPADGEQSLTIQLEQFYPQADKAALAVPVIEALDVSRQQGTVIVKVAPAIRVETAERSGLLQMDATDLTSDLAREKPDFAYRYAAVPFALKLTAEKVEPRVTVDSLTVVDLTPERLALSLWALYDVQRAGVFRLEWDVPEGYSIQEVRGIAPSGVAAARVDTYHLTGEKKTRLVVNLAAKAMGRTGLLVRLEKSVQHPELLAPPEKPAQIDVVAPRVAGPSIEEDRGRLVIRSPESLRVNPAKQKGLRAISFGEAMQGMDPAAGATEGSVRPMFAFAFSRDAVELTLAAERRKPQVTVGQLLTLRIEDDALQYEAVFHYDVLYSGVKSLRIDVPEALADKLRNRTPGIRERVVEPAPADVPKGYQAWSFSGETELLGKGRITLVWEEKLEKLGVGQEVTIGVPRLIPAKADDAPIDRTWGQIVLVKADSIDLRPADEPKGLRPIDPQHDLMGGARVAGAGQAFEFHGDWSLTAAATRYELEDVKHTSIELAVVRMVVTRADAVAVQALYRLVSVQQRLEVALPAGAVFDSEPLRINGQPVTLERGGQDRFFIPLTSSSGDKPLVVDLRYTLPGEERGHDAAKAEAGSGSRGSAGELSLPEFPEKPAVLKVFLCVYLPEERSLLGAKGPWTNETRWRPDGTMNWWKPVYPEADAQLIEPLKKDVSMTTDPTEGFQTDGRRYVFSTLRPTEGLRLVQMKETTLTAIVLAALVLGGLVLVAASCQVRVLAVGGLVTAIVLCGVFAPLFTRQVLDGYFLAALVVVAVVWTVACVWRHRPCCRPITAATTSASQPPTAAAASGPPETARPVDADSAPAAGEAASPFGEEGGKSNE